jgi:TRAP-type C4-dicarboxylate transport system substrate-binding protein
MTTILTGNGFWNTLTGEQQEAFKIVAKKVAKLEREWSVDDAAEYEKNAIANGVTIVDLSDQDRETLKRVSQKSYLHMNDVGVDRKLIAEIIKEGRGRIQ